MYTFKGISLFTHCDLISKPLKELTRPKPWNQSYTQAGLPSQAIQCPPPKWHPLQRSRFFSHWLCIDQFDTCSFKGQSIRSFNQIHRLYKVLYLVRDFSYIVFHHYSNSANFTVPSYLFQREREDGKDINPNQTQSTEALSSFDFGSSNSPL